MKKKVKNMKFYGQNCLGKYKLKTTMYFDYDYDYLTDDKPDGRYKEDYDMFRFGTTFYCFEINDEIREDYSIENEYKYILLKNPKFIQYILLQDLTNIDLRDFEVVDSYEEES